MPIYTTECKIYKLNRSLSKLHGYRVIAKSMNSETGEFLLKQN